MRKPARKAAKASTLTCSPEMPRNILSSWKLLSPVERHVYNCFYLGENPINTAFLKGKRLPSENMSIFAEAVNQTLNRCPML